MAAAVAQPAAKPPAPASSASSETARWAVSTPQALTAQPRRSAGGLPDSASVTALQAASSAALISA